MNEQFTSAYRLGTAIDPSFVEGLDALTDAALVEAAQAAMLYASQVEAYQSNVSVPMVTPPLLDLEVRTHLGRVLIALKEWIMRLSEDAKSYGSSRRAFEAYGLASALPAPGKPSLSIGDVTGWLTIEHDAISSNMVVTFIAALRDSVQKLEARIASAQGSVAVPIAEPISATTIGLSVALVAVIAFALS